MDETEKKQYVLNSLMFDKGSRITEVINRYFKDRTSARKLKNLKTESDTMDVTKKLFS